MDSKKAMSAIGKLAFGKPPVTVLKTSEAGEHFPYYYVGEYTYIGTDNERHYFTYDFGDKVDAIDILTLSVEDVSVTRGLNSCLVEVKQ